jgi:hypothetical protein
VTLDDFIARSGLIENATAALAAKEFDEMEDAWRKSQPEAEEAYAELCEQERAEKAKFDAIALSTDGGNNTRPAT